MAKRAGIRKVVKWGGLAVSVLVAVAWVGSCWYAVGWMTRHGRLVGVDRGTVVTREVALSTSSARGDGFCWQRDDLEMFWWFDWNLASNDRYAAMPLWFPLLIAAGATATAWRADVRERRRQRVGACPACGYDRRALDAAKVCPECGAADANGQMTK